MAKIGKSALLFLVMASAFLSFPTLADDPPQVQASVDRNQISAGDTLTYTISVTSHNAVTIEDPRLPNLKHFDLINTWSGTESSSSFSNGTFTVQRTRSYNYMLSASQKGTFTIGASQVVVDGKSYVTQPITIHVTAAGQGGRPAPQARRQQNQNDPFAQMDQMEDMFDKLLQRQMGGRLGQIPPPSGGGNPHNNPRLPPSHTPTDVNPNEAFFVAADVDKKQAYVGEQITASWYLYTRGQIADIDTLKYPDLRGFWKEELEMATRLNYQQVVINGIIYQKALLVSYALFPIKSGEGTIDSYKAKCTVILPSSFGFGRPYPYTKASPPIKVRILPLPKDSQPANFTGAVGHFRVTAKLQSATTPANQPITLDVRFEGDGNAKLIDLPHLDVPKSIEVYDQKADAKFFKDGTSYKDFQVVLIPREEGHFEIPPMQFSYFDPSSAKYVNISTKKLDLTVTPGQPIAPTQDITQATTGTPGKSAAPKDAFPAPVVQYHPGWWATVGSEPMPWMGLYALAFLSLLGRAYRVFWFEPKVQDLTKMIRARLKKVQSLIDKGDWRNAGVEMTNAAYLVMGQITDQGGANLPFEKLMDLAPPSLRVELSEPFRKLLSQTELLSFAPETLVGDLKTKKSLNRLKKDLEKVLLRATSLAGK